uniref:Uncharacterized protein n=1 Tax=Amphimedon queenslandica TaxID=400682 RepID=A0A1X7U485_AMPQE
MLAFAIAFYFFFSHKPYIDRAAAQVPCLVISTDSEHERHLLGHQRELYRPDPCPSYSAEPVTGMMEP